MRVYGFCFITQLFVNLSILSFFSSLFESTVPNVHYLPTLFFGFTLKITFCDSFSVIFFLNSCLVCFCACVREQIFFVSFLCVPRENSFFIQLSSVLLSLLFFFSLLFHSVIHFISVFLVFLSRFFSFCSLFLSHCSFLLFHLCMHSSFFLFEWCLFYSFRVVFFVLLPKFCFLLFFLPLSFFCNKEQIFSFNPLLSPHQ